MSKPHTGFACLQSLDSPQYYMYSYRAQGRTAKGDGFTAVANGDSNGDGATSTFSVSGKVGPSDVLATEPQIEETNPQE